MITCIVQPGMANKIVAAAQEAGATGATLYFTRGEWVRERLGKHALAVEAEQEVIIVAVADDQADHIFERMYIARELDTPGMGFIYMTKLNKAATHIPQEVLSKIESGEIQTIYSGVSMATAQLSATMKLGRHELITRIMPKGTGRKVLVGLRKELGITTGNINMARGAGMYNPLVKRGIGEETEKEMLPVVVPAEKAGEIFEYIYDLAEIGEPHHGLIFQSDLLCASQYEVPSDIADEDD